MYSCQVPVALIFFNRPDTFEKVFERVREAKPKKLYLIQDGPRNDNDIPKIMECRKIAESIDWKCEIIKDYSEVNLGCGVRPQSGITSALKNEESIIILEDDCVPANSFFPYCEEMLEKYKDDERICYISGLNHFEKWDCGESDYFFTKTGAIWGWATWKRAWDRYDYYMNDIDDERVLSLVQNQITNKHSAKVRVESWKKAKKSLDNGEKLSYWDTQWGFAQFTQNMLAIVPRANQISNIGAGADSTHTQNITSAKYIKYKNVFSIPTYEFSFPLKHPPFCVCDRDYHNLVYRLASGSRLKQILKTIKRRLLK